MCFAQVVNLKLFCPFWKSKQKQIYVWNLYKTSKSAKKWSSIFGLIKETMDLSCILLTVQWHLFFSCALFLFVSLRSVQINHFFMIHCCSKGQGEPDERFFYDSFYLDIFLLMKFIPHWTIFLIFNQLYHKGPSINYVVSKSVIFDPLNPLCRLFTK